MLDVQVFYPLSSCPGALVAMTIFYSFTMKRMKYMKKNKGPKGFDLMLKQELGVETS